MCGEHHLCQRHQQAAVGAVVIGKNFFINGQLANRREKILQARGIVEIRRDIANLCVHLRQSGCTEPVPARAEIDQHQLGVGLIAPEQRRQRGPGIAHHGKRGDHQ